MSLLADVKLSLDIDENDFSYDKKLNIIVEDGKQYLCSFNPLLTDEDFEKSTRARRMLLAYCRYAFSNAEEMFEENYKSDIISLRQEYEVLNFEKQNQN